VRYSVVRSRASLSAGGCGQGRERAKAGMQGVGRVGLWLGGPRGPAITMVALGMVCLPLWLTHEKKSAHNEFH